MDLESNNLEERKNENFNQDEKDSADFKKIVDEQEESSVSSNDYGGSNEVDFMVWKIQNIVLNYTIRKCGVDKP